MTSEPDTLRALTERGADQAVALEAPNRRPLTYRRLRDQVAATGRALGTHTVRRGDTVAVVLENGPELATAFLAIGCSAAVAPLNPGSSADEFALLLRGLGARLLVLRRDADSPARAVARQLGVATAELHVPREVPAGVFELHGASTVDAPPPDQPVAGDVALVMHTSGTTSRPKIVPLSHRNVCSSASHIVDALGLCPADRGLNIMPLFHVHGLVGAIAAPLAAGGSVWCSPGFNALLFFSWMASARPTWYTAVPSMHRAILARAARHTSLIAESQLRFVRSSSAKLPSRLMRELEDTFRVPVVEAYGMTEAAHQVTSNQLPPGGRQEGTVGRAAGTDIAIVSPEREMLARGLEGEVVIRGPNLFRGYQTSHGIDREMFVGEWFRTGDQGQIDEQGYLRLTGRLKEIINRGGEKISPMEIEEVFLEHPAVVDVAAFAIPHSLLGEEAVVAVVRASGEDVSERDLRRFAGTRLADIKVPRRVVFVDEIPSGPTRKTQRLGLAKLLGVGRESLPS